MTSPQHKQVRGHVLAAITSRGQADIISAEIERDVRRDYPEACAALADEAVAAYVRSIVQGALKTMRTTNAALPGLDLPEYLTLPAEGGVVYRAVDMSTEGDFMAHDRMLAEQIDADRRARSEFRKVMDRVVRVLHRNHVDRLADLP